MAVGAQDNDGEHSAASSSAAASPDQGSTRGTRHQAGTHNADAVTLNGRIAARWARRTVERLRRERGDINELNVFPVPDGDTGTNLYHTVRSAYLAVEQLQGAVTLPDVISAMATGALRGARGNSGLILSVALRGVADALEDVTVADAESLASALETAAERARQAVARPVDGTMLTVLEAMATEARAQAAAGAPLVDLITAVRERSRSALIETTDQLQVLSEAQVVDAGSTGIVELFDLLYFTVTGQEPGAAITGEFARPPAGLVQEAGADELEIVAWLAQPNEDEVDQDVKPGTDSAADPAVDSAVNSAADSATDRAKLLAGELEAAGGTSIVITWPKVHVHVPDEESALVALTALDVYGIAQLRVEDLSVTGCDTDIVLVAMATGPGLLMHCALNGAVALNPELLDPAEHIAELAAIPDAEVIVVPNSMATLARARDRIHVLPNVHLVRARDLGAMLSAVAVFDAQASVDEIVADMTEAAAGTRVGAVVVADSSGSRGRLHWLPQDLLTIIDSKVRAVSTSEGQVAAEDIEAAVTDLADRLLGAGGELVTVVTGKLCPETVVHSVRMRILGAHPEVHIQVLDSAHPQGLVLLGVE